MPQQQLLKINNKRGNKYSAICIIFLSESKFVCPGPFHFLVLHGTVYISVMHTYMCAYRPCSHMSITVPAHTGLDVVSSWLFLAPELSSYFLPV